MPTVRRSCQPMPGATGFPLARSHTMLDARWLAIPTPATGPPVLERRSCDLQHGVGHPGGVELHQTRSRRVGQQGDAVLVLDGGVRTDDGGADTRRPDVDDENAAPARAHAQGAGPKGEARPNLPGLRMPLGSKVALSPRKHLEARAERPGQEAGAVEPDAVVMADRRTVRHGGVGHGVPRLAVVALPPFGVALGPAPAEGEVEAGAVGIGVGLVRRRRQRPVDLS